MEHKELHPDHEKLDYGDYIVAGRIIERKTTGDFIGSVLDKRLWNQVDGLKCYTELKPTLLIEGSWGYTLKRRNFSYEQVYGLLNSITIDYGIPIIRTTSRKKTVEYFARLVRKLGGNVDQHHAIRHKGLKDKSLSYQQRFVLEGFPGVGPTKATKLLQEGKKLVWVLENFLDPSGRHVYHYVDLEKILGEKLLDKITFDLFTHDFNEDEV